MTKGRLRRRLIAEQIADLVAIDRRLHEVGEQIKVAVAETPTGLTSLFGVGPVTTARVLGEVGNVARFRTRPEGPFSCASADDWRVPAQQHSARRNVPSRSLGRCPSEEQATKGPRSGTGEQAADECSQGYSSTSCGLG